MVVRQEKASHPRSLLPIAKETTPPSPPNTQSFKTKASRLSSKCWSSVRDTWHFQTTLNWNEVILLGQSVAGPWGVQRAEVGKLRLRKSKTKLEGQNSHIEGPFPCPVLCNTGPQRHSFHLISDLTKNGHISLGRIVFEEFLFCFHSSRCRLPLTHLHLGFPFCLSNCSICWCKQKCTGFFLPSHLMKPESLFCMETHKKSCL